MTKLRNIGPKSWNMLFEAGFSDVDAICKVGAVATFAEVRNRNSAVSLNLLRALYAGLQDRDWRTVTAEEKAELLHELEG